MVQIKPNELTKRKKLRIFTIWLGLWYLSSMQCIHYCLREMNWPYLFASSLLIYSICYLQNNFKLAESTEKFLTKIKIIAISITNELFVNLARRRPSNRIHIKIIWPTKSSEVQLNFNVIKTSFNVALLLRCQNNGTFFTQRKLN